MEVYLIPYAYDRITEESGNGSRTRCDALLRKVVWPGNPDHHYNYILTAGFSKESPANPSEKAPESLARQMGRYIQEGCPKFGRTVWTYVFPTAWGTYDETRVAIACIKRRLSPDDDKKVPVYVSTNLGHMPRVWLCWFFLKPRKWRVHFVTASHSFTPKEWLQESTKVLQYLYKFVFGKW